MDDPPTRDEARAGGGRAASLAALLFFAAATIVLTWPLGSLDGRPYSLRPDYFQNLWNVWWMRTAVLDQGVSPYWTDALYHPDGISLAKHTLSPVNSLPAAWLSRSLGEHDAMKVMVLLHFWLSGWTMFLLARWASGSAAGGVLAGLVWSFAPFHLHFLPQINLTTMEFLPLAVLFLLRTWRYGGLGNAVGVAASAALLAASSSYYLVYAALFGGLLLLAGRLWTADVPWRRGAARLAPAAIAAGAVVAAVAWPLLRAALSGDGAADATGDAEGGAANALAGFRWLVGPPGKRIVAWPVMLGYSSMLLALLGARSVIRQPFWLLVGLTFFLLGLGPTLHVGEADTGIPLPSALLDHLPVLSMLRKPDRYFVMVQLAFCVLLAFAWTDLRGRLVGTARRVGAFALLVVLVSVELGSVPVGTGAIVEPAHVGALAEMDDVHAVLDVPVMKGSLGMRSMFHQTRHGKKITRGYVTSLALSEDHRRDEAEWLEADRLAREGDATFLAERAAARGIDAVVLHKTVPRPEDPPPPAPTVWTPFPLSGPDLVSARQTARWKIVHILARRTQSQRRAMARVFGPPVFEDDFAYVFRVR